MDKVTFQKTVKPYSRLITIKSVNNHSWLLIMTLCGLSLDSVSKVFGTNKGQYVYVSIFVREMIRISSCY